MLKSFVQTNKGQRLIVKRQQQQQQQQQPAAESTKRSKLNSNQYNSKTDAGMSLVIHYFILFNTSCYNQTLPWKN